MDTPALINSFHIILKITYELSNENASFSFHKIIKKHIKENNLVTLSLNRL